MAKRSRPSVRPIDPTTDPPDDRKRQKRLKRLERELAELQATEVKRVEQLKEVRATAGDIRARLTALRAAVARTAGADTSPRGPIGYCMREKRPVEIKDPKRMTLSNGRTAVAGTCSTCGARVVALSARATPAEA